MRVAIELIRPRQPQRAAAQAVAPLFSSLASARPLQLIDMRWQVGPGLQVAPWTLAGVRDAAERAGLKVQSRSMEVAPARGGGLGPIDRVHADLPGTRRARSIPKEWFGQHLVLALPFALDPHGSRDTGPLHAALRALDREVGGPRRRESAGVAARLLSTVFASVTIVVDGSWWADVGDGTDAARELVALDRCFACGIDHPDPAWSRQALRTLDGWFVHQLRGGGRGVESPVHATGSGLRTTWPRARRAPGIPAVRGLSTRAIEALWKPAPPSRTRLGPAVPGDLARLWHEWRAAETPA